MSASEHQISLTQAGFASTCLGGQLPGNLRTGSIEEVKHCFESLLTVWRGSRRFLCSPGSGALRTNVRYRTKVSNIARTGVKCLGRLFASGLSQEAAMSPYLQVSEKQGSERWRPQCAFCTQTVCLEDCKANEYGQAVHEHCYVTRLVGSQEKRIRQASGNNPKVLNATSTRFPSIFNL
jgi:hypothetical protein